MSGSDPNQSVKTKGDGKRKGEMTFYDLEPKKDTKGGRAPEPENEPGDTTDGSKGGRTGKPP